MLINMSKIADSHLDVRNPDNDILKLVVLPRIRRPFDHGKRSVVLLKGQRIEHDTGMELDTHKFVILDVQEHKLWPEVRTLCSLDDLGDVDAGDKQLEVLHN